MIINLKFFESLSIWARILNQWTRCYAMTFRRDQCFAERERKTTERRLRETRLQEDLDKAALRLKDRLKSMQLEKVELERAQAEAQLARAVFDARVRYAALREHEAHSC